MRFSRGTLLYLSLGLALAVFLGVCVLNRSDVAR